MKNQRNSFESADARNQVRFLLPSKERGFQWWRDLGEQTLGACSVLAVIGEHLDLNSWARVGRTCLTIWKASLCSPRRIRWQGIGTLALVNWVADTVLKRRTHGRPQWVESGRDAHNAQLKEVTLCHTGNTLAKEFLHGPYALTLTTHLTFRDSRFLDEIWLPGWMENLKVLRISQGVKLRRPPVLPPGLNLEIIELRTIGPTSTNCPRLPLPTDITGGDRAPRVPRPHDDSRRVTILSEEDTKAQL